MSDAPAAAPPLLNKAELAQVLETSLPTLDKMLRRWPDFPVVSEGTNGRAWQFDAGAVQSFLQRKRDEDAAAGAAKDELMAQFTLPGVEPEEARGVSPADQLRLAQLRKIQREEQREAGFLVQITELRPLLVDTWSRYNRDVTSGIRQAMREHNIPEATIRSVEARIAEAQRKVVAALQSLMDEEQQHGDQPALI